MAYIDKDLLIKDIGESVVFTVRNAETSPELRGARKIIDRIENAPTADVVEVKCRCADCKHYQRYGRTSLVFEGKNVQAGWCMLRAKTDEEHRMLPFDFCSYGERK